jgi:ABC-type proline/glycine betaine transport system, permease component
MSHRAYFFSSRGRAHRLLWAFALFVVVALAVLAGPVVEAAETQSSALASSSSSTGTSSPDIPLFACNSGKPVRFADQNWESASFLTHVFVRILHDVFSCQTEIVPGTPAAAEAALGQNDLQVIAEIWSGRSAIIEDAIKAGKVKVVGDTLEGGAEQGWYVPDYVVKGDPARGIAPMAPDLQTWQDLPRYKELFRDAEEPSKGRFLNCPTGWVCEGTNSRLLSLYGLDEHFNNFRAGTGAALDASISAAYERGQPLLFYYWQPAGLMAKYRFHRIGLPPFNEACWDTIVSGKGDPCPTDFLAARLAVALSAPFAEAQPDIVAFFEKVQFKPELLNGAILEMTEQRIAGSDMAERFLKQNPEVWSAWLNAEQAQRLEVALGGPSSQATSGIFVQWSGAEFVNRHLAKAVKAWGDAFRRMGDVLLVRVLLPVESFFMAVPAWALLAIVAVLSWHATRKPIATVLYVLGLYLIGVVGLWDKLIQTFSLVLVSTLISILIGVPLGIWAAGSRWLRRALVPIMDVMQTLPSFVYLIPVLMLFGLGKVPALFATIIYAVPPLIRLTILGLRQVDPAAKEAAQSFGVTRWQMLTRVTLPLARPSIMAGINQTTMMALAMVVVASMIGARGLGEDVLAGIQTLDIGRGLQAGIAIVILAIVIDRITQAYGRPARTRLAMRRARQ